MKNIKNLLAVSSLAAANFAFAAGYQIVEQGAANMGNAMAGATANANNDASAAFWNPSAACFMPLEVGKTRVDSVLSLVLPTLCVNDKPWYVRHKRICPKFLCSPQVHGGTFWDIFAHSTVWSRIQIQ